MLLCWVTITVSSCMFIEYNVNIVAVLLVIVLQQLYYSSSILQIPIIQRAMRLAHPTPIRLFGSAWGAPAWMKDNANITGKGKIKPQHYSTWAKYHVR